MRDRVAKGEEWEEQWKGGRGNKQNCFKSYKINIKQIKKKKNVRVIH